MQLILLPGCVVPSIMIRFMSGKEHNEGTAPKRAAGDTGDKSKASHGADASSNTGRTKGWGRRGGGTGWGAFGGYMAAKKQKLDSQFNRERGQVSHIFEGVAIYINGYTNPSSDELRRLIMEHGGRYEQYLMKTRVTHIIATNLPDSKIRDLHEMKVVRPEWILDSIKAGRLLSHASYKLYTTQGNSLESFSTVITHSSRPGTSDNAEQRLEKIHYKQVNCCAEDAAVEPGTGQNTKEKSSDNMGQSCDAKKMNLLASLAGSSNDTPHAVSTAEVPSVREHVEHTHASPPKTFSSYRPLQDKARLPAKAGDPNFLTEFYSHSRLHHISTWGVEFRAYVSKLQKESMGHFPGRLKLREFHVQKMVERGFESCLETSKCGKPFKLIMHVDMDCFFVSVGLLTHPEYRGKPVAVTHSHGKGLTDPIPGSDFEFERSNWRRNKKARAKTAAEISSAVDPESGSDKEEEVLVTSVMEPHAELDLLDTPGMPEKHPFHSLAEIASCSYEARKAGIKNGMLMGEARQLCPELLTIHYDFKGYNRVSRCLYDTVTSYTHDIEAVSCDEMLVDCTDLLADTGASPLEFAELLRKDIVEKTGCTASAGLGSNILLARLATRHAKPNGQFHLLQDEVMDFMKKQSVKDLPGVGWSISRKLNAMGVVTCEDLQRISLAALQKEFGPKTGQSLYKFCHGKDDRIVRTEKERKSVSAEINYGIRFQSDSEAVKFVEELAAEVGSRLHAIGMKGRTMTLKLMVRRPDAPVETAKFMGHGICNNFSKSASLPLPTDSADLLGKEAVGLLKAMKVNCIDLRGIGIQVHRLEPAAIGGAPGFGAKGNQSILNFAVAKQQDFEKLSCPSSSNAQSGNGDGTGNVLEGACKVASSCKVQDQQTAHKGRPVNQEHEGMFRMESSEERLPPLPFLSGLQDDRPSTREVTRREGTEFFLSPSQVDRRVLQELPSDIRQQIEEELQESKRSRYSCTTTVRPSPRKPADASEPGCSHWATPSEEPTGELSKEKSRKFAGAEDRAEEDLDISFSQIDPDILKELPDDVRKQLEEDLKAAKRRRQNFEAATSKSHDKQCEDADGSCKQRNSKESTICALPNLSQLDPSCMEALPKNLQDEITAAYSRQQGLQSVNSPTKNHPVTSGQSRGRGRGRGKGRGRGHGGRPGGKGSPLFKVPQGKPAVNRKKSFTPKKLDFETENNNLQCYSSSFDQDAAPSATSENAVSLCGAVTLPEIRTLLSEWLQSATDPQDQDVDELVKYLGQLVLDFNLEMVDLILKFLHRKTSNENMMAWRKSFQDILHHTQDIVKSVYGSSLKADWLSRIY